MNEHENKAAQNNAQEVKTPEQAAIELCAGKMILAVPFLSDDKEITELSYDFRALTGVELADALDRGASETGGNAFRITNRQALEVFAAAAAKKTEGADAVDIKRGLSGQDAIKAAQLATVFFVASSREGNNRITKA